MKKPYKRPKLVELGSLRELTLGSTGLNADYTYGGGILAPDTNAPVCSSNTGACVKFTS